MGVSAAYLVDVRPPRQLRLHAGGLAPRARVRDLRRAALSSAAAGSPSWSTAAASTPRASRGCCATAAPRSSTTSCSTRCWSPAPPDAIARVQADGTCWVGGTVWRGRDGDADLRVRLGDDRRRRRALGGGDPQRACDVRASTSMLPRVAFEYGQRSCALATQRLGLVLSRAAGTLDLERDREPEPALTDRADVDLRGRPPRPRRRSRRRRGARSCASRWRSRRRSRARTAARGWCPPTRRRPSTAAAPSAGRACRRR